MELYVVLAVTLFMMVMFVWHKVPFGVTTMTCCVVFVITGVMDIQTAFSGFSNKIIVLIAPMMVMGAVLTRTSLVGRIRDMMEYMKGKHGILLVLSLFAVTALLAQFIPATAVLAIMVVFLGTLGNTGNITSGRLILPMLGITSAWKFRTPIGIGATMFAGINALYMGILPDSQYALTMFDPFLFSILPLIVLTLYCIFGWRLMPEDNVIDGNAVKQDIKKSDLTQKKETIVYVAFACSMLVMVLNRWTGNFMYLAPAIAVLVLIYTGIVSVPDAVKNMTCDMIWMIAGVLTVADALGKSGAGALIGNILLGMIGQNPSSFSVMLLFSAVTVIMTNFLSNAATQTVLVPIAASVALAGGWDPRGMILIAGLANMYDIAFPSGSGEAAVAFAAGGYNPMKVLRFSLPYMCLTILTCAVSANILYPIYG